MKNFVRALVVFMVVAPIVFLIVCGIARCADIKLAWNRQDDASSFRVWRGIECLATVPTNGATVTAPDEPCSITVTAVNGEKESAHSKPLDLIVVFLEESLDLQNWKTLQPIHREMKDKAFYRIGFKGPAGRNIRITYQVEVLP